MKRYLLRISYDGTNFCGWQSQKNENTIQQTIEKALSEIAKTKIQITGAGRTDAGVHALRQYAHFDFPLKMSSEQILLAALSKLPPDIRIQKVFPVKNDFHARFDAFSRKYLYIITKERTPFNRFYKSYVPRKNISFDTLKKCIVYFEGRNDFTSFSKLNPDIPHNFCTIQKISWKKKEDDIVLEITANRFLHNMIRRIVGAMINISHANENPEIIKMLLENKDPNHKLISKTPPEGLYLSDVRYPQESFL